MVLTALDLLDPQTERAIHKGTCPFSAESRYNSGFHRMSFTSTPGYLLLSKANNASTISAFGLKLFRT